MRSRGHSYKLDLLKKVPLFKDLKKDILFELAQITDEVQEGSGAILARQGGLGSELVFIIEGEARVERDGQVIGRLSSNDFFGEISVIDMKPRTASVIAETDVRLLVVHSRFFRELMERVPGLQYALIVALCRYLRVALREGKGEAV